MSARADILRLAAAGRTAAEIAAELGRDPDHVRRTIRDARRDGTPVEGIDVPNLDDHPLAAIFPLMTDPELKTLADDIDANGLREPLWLYEGKILDGRNRYRACALRDVDPRVEHYRGKDPLGFVVSKNLHRRHLTESQRAMVAARIANAKAGRPLEDETAPIGAVSNDEAAALLNVGAGSVDRAKAVLANGTPELVAAVDAGTVTVGAAAEVAKLPEEEQREAVAGGPEAVKDKAKEQRAKKGKAEPSANGTHKPPAEPEHPADDFAGKVAELCRRLDGCKATLADLVLVPHYGSHIHLDSVRLQIEAARKALWQSRPTEPCNCVKGGNPPAPACKACFGTGRTTPSRVLKGAR